MQAALLTSYDAGVPLRVVELPTPVLKRGQVLVRMAASPINPSDLVFLRGRYGVQKKLPVVPGFEGSGVVIDARAGLYGRRLIGKRVACRAPEDGNGTWAGLTACTATDCIPLKADVSFEQGACLFINPLTAWLLFERARAGGHRAFIQTAAGGALGRMLARLARRARFPAIHIVRDDTAAEALNKEGARYVLNSAEPDFSARLSALAAQLKATLVLDTVGGTLTGRVASALPRGSQIVVIGALSGQPLALNPEDLIFRGLSVNGFWLTETLKGLSLSAKLTLARRVQSRLETDLVTTIQARFELPRINEAIMQYKLWRSQGKTLIELGRAA
jgi:NADPH:quinone reductase-like Zn-dependent oxidoreductase